MHIISIVVFHVPQINGSSIFGIEIVCLICNEVDFKIEFNSECISHSTVVKSCSVVN